MSKSQQVVAGMLFIAAISTSGCISMHTPDTTLPPTQQLAGKPVIYQVFTRLFGNKQTTNRPWGTIEENGVGKFNDFTDKALSEINRLGVTHIWYTGVPHHTVINDYTNYGISLDDPDVVKGRAGSPYAVKDYYNVNPDLAIDPANRLAEFEALIERTHKHNMQVIIDIVPNHVARNYHSVSAPKGKEDFGFRDNKAVEYAVNNNFYYIVDQPFIVPVGQNGYQPLGGQNHPLADGQFNEKPAKWTGNGSRKAQPDANDWYETVKVNYGVRPDGTKDFAVLPDNYAQLDYQQHWQFWKDKVVPDSWVKFKNITHYWLDKGVDGFRYDMAEMVPVEFWSYLNSSIKMKNPQAFLLAEVYNPDLYRDYIHLGKMDYLYDKVEFYDNLKLVMQQKSSTDPLEVIQSSLADIESHMLHFLENHDEQRIASPGFAGEARWGKPAMVVSSLISRSPTMVYFGQEVGEDGSEDAGFGSPSRTSIFDYIGVPSHQRWMNNGKFDGGQLTPTEKQLREYYKQVLNISAKHPAMLGRYDSLHSFNRWAENGYGTKQYAFARSLDGSGLIVVSNFDPDQSVTLSLLVPKPVLEHLQINTSRYVTDLLTEQKIKLAVNPQTGQGSISVILEPLQSYILSSSNVP